MNRICWIFLVGISAGCSGNEKAGDEGTVEPTGDAPVVWIQMPGDGDLLSSDTTTHIEANITDDLTPVTELVVTLESTVGGSIDHEGSVDDAGLFSVDVLLPGGVQTITLSATDSDDRTGSDAIEVQVNGSPGTPVIAIEPAIPPVGATLTAVIVEEAADPDDDEVSYAWEWTVQIGDDGSPSPYPPEGDPTVVPGELTERGQIWTVTATPTDAVGNTGTPNSASATVGNSAPNITDAVLEPDPAFTNDSVSVTPSGWTDVDGDEENYQYAWTINGSEVADADGPTLSASAHVKGDSVVAIVTPFDGFSYGDPLEAGPVVISNSPPSALTVALTPSEAATTDDISSTVVGWSDLDGDPEGYSYRWIADGVTIPDATDPVLDASLTEHFQEIQVEVTPNDGELDGMPILSESITIGNTVPAITRVLLSPDPPTTADAIEAIPAGWSDLDGDGEAYNYAWTVNGIGVGTDSPILSPSLTMRDDVIQCAVTPSDGTDVGATVSSDAVTVANSPPSIGSAIISPATAVYGDTLTCSWTAFVDPDADTDASTMQWFIDGTPAGTDSTLTSGFHGGNVVSCVVTPNDGIDTGSSVEASVTIGNTAPSLGTAIISPDPAVAGTTLSCTTTGFTDVDGDADASTTEWTINGDYASSDDSISSGFVRADEVLCTVTPSDGMATGDPVSDSLVISNTPPSIDSVAVSPATADWSTVLSCTFSGYSDVDGDPDESRLEWLNGDDVVLGTGPALSGGFAGGESIRCRVTPNDGFDDGVAIDSTPVVIDNAPPSLDGASLYPLEPTVASTMNCTPGTATDPDGTTSFSYTYRWEVAGVPFPGETGSSLTAPAFARGQSIQCHVTVHDDVDAGAEVGSNIVIVQNSLPVVDDLSIGPSVVKTNDTITATVALSDDDGDPVAALYQWKVNGIVVTEVAEDSAVLNGVDHFDKHDSVAVTVTPSESVVTGVPVTSDAIVILNTAPGSPVVDVSPAFPEPEADLSCLIVADAPDVDFDVISYDYQWYLEGSPTSYTSSVVPSSATAHGEHWECEVTANDGETTGGTSTDSAVVNDLTNPDPPQFDDLAEHTNTTSQTLTGDCEPGCEVDINCDADTGSGAVAATTCSGLGRFSTTVDIDRGDVLSCTGTCTDGAGNMSGPSPVHQLESCDPYDIYEDASDYGDHPGDVVDEWATISDAGTSIIEIRGNVLDDDDDDWFVVSASDDLSADLSAGKDFFNFSVELTAGVSDYRFVVHRGGTGAGEEECPVLEGYSDYNWFVEDNADGSHSAPSDTRSCRSSDTLGYNDCEDNTSDFYVHVYRMGSSTVDCDSYELTITNGVW
jgi:hypothetical protein